MLEEGKIDSKQLMFLLINIVLSTAILFVPAITAHHGKQDAWLAAIIAVLGGLLLCKLFVTLGLRFPDMTLFQFSEVIMGKFIGKVIGLLYLWWAIIIAATVLREFGSFLVSVFMPETPIIVFIIVLAILAAYTIYSGLEIFSRVSELFIPIILFSVIILFILAIPEMKLSRLQPLFDTPFIDIFKGAFAPLAWFGELVALLVILPYLNKTRQSPTIAYTATLISGLFFLLVILGIIAIFGPLTPKLFFPTLNGARIIHLANFLERLEATIMVIWVTGVFIKVCVFYYILVLGTAQVFGLKDFRPLILPIGVILVNCSMLFYKSIVEIPPFLGQVWPPLSLSVYCLGLPLLLLVVSIFRGIGGKQH